MANLKSSSTSADPRERFPKPPFPQKQQTGAGSSNELNPPADYGEESYQGHERLKDRVALITGGDSGIGRAIALCFAKEGADILFVYLPEEQDDANETVRVVKSTGRKAVAVPGDLRQKSFCQDVVSQTVRELGSSTFWSTMQPINEPMTNWKTFLKMNLTRLTARMYTVRFS
jgi:hypothetical protein